MLPLSSHFNLKVTSTVAISFVKKYTSDTSGVPSKMFEMNPPVSLRMKTKDAATKHSRPILNTRRNSHAGQILAHFTPG